MIVYKVHKGRAAKQLIAKSISFCPGREETREHRSIAANAGSFLCVVEPAHGIPPRLLEPPALLISQIHS